MSEPLPRAQAIRDGVLVDLSGLNATKIHWKCPVVCTAAVWTVISDAVMRHGQNLEALMHEVSFKIMEAASKCPGHPVVSFEVEIGGQICWLKACHDQEATESEAITLIFPDEFMR